MFPAARWGIITRSRRTLYLRWWSGCKTPACAIGSWWLAKTWIAKWGTALPWCSDFAIRAMRAHSKLKIDRLIGGPLCLLLNLAARCAGAVLRRDHRIPPAHVQAICVAKYAGMGSILSALPLVTALKDCYPNAKLVFISSGKNAALLERGTGIDERLYVNEESLGSVILSTLTLCLRLWRLHPALYIDLELYS